VLSPVPDLLPADHALTQAAQALLSAVFPLDRPYFQHLMAEADRDAFCRQQRQFRFAVAHFAQPLALLCGRLADPHLRDRIVRNVWEEHGQGDPSRWHDASFRQFLRLLGIPQAAIEGDRPDVAVDAFNTTLRGLCAADDPATAAAALGMIELMFSRISATIARTVVDHGWLPEDSLVHYNLHAALDIDHAEDLFAVAATGSAPSVERGLQLGRYLFDRLYEDLRQL
jgi:pyrroloquinoline-quinone synthase